MTLRVFQSVILLAAMTLSLLTEAPPARGQAIDEPFAISAFLLPGDSDGPVLAVSAAIREGCYLYADKFDVSVDGQAELVPISSGKTQVLKDEYTGGEFEVLAGGFTNVYSVRNMESDVLKLAVSFQGCEKKVCFMPESRRFELSVTDEGIGSGMRADSGLKEADGEGVVIIPEGFSIVATVTGYMNAREFLAFLDSGRVGGGDDGGPGDMAMRFLKRGSLLLTLLGVILGGLALNLTPCVLPMIPINIAIIGAGAGAGRARGFLLGGLYGAGMAIAYGIAGLIVVVTGSMFGAINSSPWFNLGVAVLFLALGLSMFDLFALDLSRFIGRAGGGGRSAATVLVMGAVSALLAGACVAPVVIFVLVHSAGMYAQGSNIGLLLPFLLGVGMALPWPFAGAGLALLPKPGTWMVRVKAAFGLLILVASVYYFFTGAALLFGEQRGAAGAAASEAGHDLWVSSLEQGFERSRAEGKPMVVDFWASWCKTCLAMEATTFKDDAVRERLGDFVAVKYRAERPTDSPNREVRAAFGVMGLPTVVILRPPD